MRTVTIIRVAIFALVISLQFPSRPALADIRPLEGIKGEALFAMRPDGPGLQTAQEIAQSVGVISTSIGSLQTYRVKLRSGLSIDSALKILRTFPDVLYAEPVFAARILATPDDPLFPNQYALTITHTNDSWDVWRPSRQAVIAVIDTGIDVDHPDLTGVIFRDNNGYPIEFNAQTGTSNAQDDNGHGTFCAGIAGAQINNTTGIAGAAGYSTIVPNSSQFIRLMPIKSFDKDGNGTTADIAAGITWAVDHGASVLSMSVGTSSQSATMDAAVKYARDHDVIVVAAAGNGAGNYLMYPAACAGVISVAATDSTDTLTDFTQYGSWVRTTAPGQNILSTLPGAQYGTLSGTSMSAPLIAGEAAAIKAQNPVLTSDEIGNVIVRHVEPYKSYSGRTLSREAGRVHVARAMKAAGWGQLILTSITINPATLANGETATGTVYTGTRVPNDTWIELVSTNPNVVSVPSGVLMPAGSTQATFTATGVASGVASTTISAYGLGPGVSTTVSVSSVKISAFTVSPTTVTGGVKVTGTVTLDGPAAPNGTPVNITFSSQAASATSPVVVPAGQTSATFQINTYPVSSSTNVQATASTGSVSVQATITVKAPVVSTVTLNPASVVGGAQSTGTITLTGGAPAGGTNVTVTSSSKLAQTPATVTVPAGQSTADFAITTSAVTANASSTIKAATGSISASATLTIKPLLSTITLAPASITGGQTSVGTVKLNGPADKDYVAQLSSADASVAQVPASVTIPQGASSADFTITSAPVAASATVAITASLLGSAKSATLSVKSATVSKVAMSPASVVGGSTSVGTVTLSGPAAAGGLIVNLDTSDPAAQTPASVTVAEGDTSVTFAATTSGVDVAKTVTINATGGGVKKSASLTIKTAVLTGISLNPTSVKGGNVSTGTVTISGPAPDAGFTITLTSSKTAATTPTSVTIPGGATSASFTINTIPVSATTSTTITAKTPAATKTATLTITP